MTGKNWQQRWKNMIAPTTIPGVWELQKGGHLVRARLVDPTTGRMRELKKVMPQADRATAFNWLENERQRIRSGLVSAQRQKTRFADYAVSLLERKIAKGEIKSAKGRERWRYTLQHLIGGTHDHKDKELVQGFGECFLDMLRVAHVEAWKEAVAKLIREGTYSPTTANGWLSVLRVILRQPSENTSSPYSQPRA